MEVIACSLGCWTNLAGGGEHRSRLREWFESVVVAFLPILTGSAQVGDGLFVQVEPQRLGPFTEDRPRDNDLGRVALLIYDDFFRDAGHDLTISPPGRRDNASSRNYAL